MHALPRPQVHLSIESARSMTQVRGVVLALIALVGVFVGAERVRYDNYRVYQVQPQAVDQLDALQAIDGASRDSYIVLDNIHHLNVKIRIIVAPQRVQDFLANMSSVRLVPTLIDNDVQRNLDKNDEPVADPNRRSNDYNWSEYHELNDTYNWLHRLAHKYPQRVTVLEAGQTYEGRQILAVKISHGKGRKAIFIEGGMHAREWISPATSTYIINELLTSTDREVRMIAEKFDWYIVPHSNPDGYVYTHTSDRMWRKTRTPYGDSCFGADPNRNWGFHWNEVGTSGKPCSDTYSGPTAFSEVETRTLAKFIESLKDELFLYISFHSYSQLLLFPYGYTAELPPNYDDLKRIFDAAMAGVTRRYGTKYTGGNIYEAIYPAAGTSIDWAYGVVDVKYAYCYELRPSSLNFWTGFRLPADQIIPTAMETVDSLVEMIKEAGIKSFL